MFLVGYYGVDNLGDEAIRWAIERAAAELGVDVVRYATRDGADADPRAVPIRFRSLPMHLLAILAADRVVLGGGGILKDEGLRLPLELAATALAARVLRRRVSLLGVGVGPFYTPIGRWLVRLTARLAHVRTVRDEASATALRALGLGRIEVGADPIFSTDSGVDAGRTVPVAAAARRDARMMVLLSVRPWFHRGPDAVAGEASRDGLRHAISGALAAATAGGARWQSMSLYWPRDRDEAAKVGSLMAGEGTLPDAGRLDWPGLLAQMAAADLVIAMRYHAVAAAALTGRPTIALAYEPKVVELGTALGIPTLDVGAADLESGLTDAVRSWQGDRLRPPAPEVVDALRLASWRILRAALLD